MVPKSRWRQQATLVRRGKRDPDHAKALVCPASRHTRQLLNKLRALKAKMDTSNRVLKSSAEHA